jgi:toxin-antitoxin system PIN domain toxin
MMIIDVNILLYAVDKRATQHATIRAWWEAALNGPEPIGLPWIVLVGFLRMSTSSRVFHSPLTPNEAIDHVNAWITNPNARVLLETGEHWSTLAELLRQTGTTGNRTTDAHLAALAISHHATLASCDTDFGRFRRLKWENPLAVS